MKRIRPLIVKFSFALYGIICSLVLGHTVQGGGLPAVDPSDVGMVSQRLAEIDSIIQFAIEEEDTPGAVILVARQGKVVYRKAFGYRSLRPVKEVMTVETIFDLASLTKVMATAPSIMILVEEGKLTLSDPVGLLLEGFGGYGKENITPLQLLTHFSGLRPGLDLDERWVGHNAAIKLAFREVPVSVPGTRFLYSDINYILLGAVVREVSGISLGEFSRQRIFAPLGMNDTGFNPSTSSARVAPTQLRDGRLLRGKVHDPTSERMGGVSGHAGLFSTIDDVAIFCQMILERGTLDGNRVLSPLAVRKMITNQAPADSDAWRGIGFDIQSKFSSSRGDLFAIGSFGHTGFTGTSIWIDPVSRTVLVILTSRLHPNSRGDVVRLRKQIANIVASAIEVPIQVE